MSAVMMTTPLMPSPASADVDGGATLDELMLETWRMLDAHGTAACPLCGGEMMPVYAAHARPVAGRCADCQSELS